MAREWTGHNGKPWIPIFAAVPALRLHPPLPRQWYHVAPAQPPREQAHARRGVPEDTSSSSHRPHRGSGCRGLAATVRSVNLSSPRTIQGDEDPLSAADAAHPGIQARPRHALCDAGAAHADHGRAVRRFPLHGVRAATCARRAPRRPLSHAVPSRTTTSGGNQLRERTLMLMMENPLPDRAFGGPRAGATCPNPCSCCAILYVVKTVKARSPSASSACIPIRISGSQALRGRRSSSTATTTRCAMHRKFLSLRCETTRRCTRRPPNVGGSASGSRRGRSHVKS